MKTRAAFTLGLSALALGGVTAGIASQHISVAFASERNESLAERQAATEADKAQSGIAGGQFAQAILHAETAVGLRPQVASFRVLLGTGYLKAGRFESARQAFADAVTLEPSNGKASLNLALALIATGDWAGARRTLDSHSDTIPVSDRGLAMALAGDPAGAVEILTAAVRSPTADAKTRQNLALSLALAGRWQEAKSMVAIDVAPNDVDQRIMQWAAFARPTSASDQVAALLGVTPVQDAGQPVALALNASSGPALAAADPVDAFMPGAPANATQVAQGMGTPAPASEAAVAAIAEPVAVAAQPAPAFSGVVFGPRQEIVQKISPQAERVASGMVAPRIANASVARGDSAPARGSYFVQLGAFENAAVAKDAWGRVMRRDASFAAHTPSGMSFSSKAGNFYRLSVGGFARSDAKAVCKRFKAKGGVCFVRAGAGDQIALWARPGRQLASR